MAKRTRLALATVGLLGAAFAGRRYLQDRTTPQVAYETVGHVGDVELRRYPPSVVVETVAPSENAAFRRLFRYISGANAGSTEVSMTAPVETAPGPRGGDTISMTAPVESASEADGVRMAFYLPEEYDYDTAPRPTDDAVRLVELPGRTLAVLGFSWWATDDRVARKTEVLRATLADAPDGFDVVGDPFLLRYEGPWVPPFLRTNEVAVPVRRARSA
jgi:hypothetical protein